MSDQFESNTEALSDTEILFDALYSESRREIISKLDSNPCTPNELAKFFNVTSTHAGRDLDRLIAAKLIIKNSKGLCHVTDYGHTIMKLIQNFSFIVKNRSFFDHRPLTKFLPEKFILNMGLLEKCEIIQGFVLVAENWRAIIRNSTKYVYSIKAQVDLELIREIHEMIQNGIEYRYILPEDVIVPPGRDELLKRLQWTNFVGEGKVKRKMVPSAPITIFMNEKESSVAFPDSSGRCDISTSLYSTDNLFHQWCYDYFMHVWNDADPFNERKVKKRS